MKPNLTRRALAAALTAGLALTAAACGGDDDDNTSPGTDAPAATDPPAEPGATDPASTDPASTDPASTDPASTEPITIKVGVYPITDYAPLYLGVRDGIFEEHDINVEIEELFSGTALMSGITSGQFDLANNSVTGGVTGILNGLPIQIVNVTTNQAAEGNIEVLVRPDSGITTWADLQGKTVATINLQGMFHLGILNAVELDGGDPSTVEAIPMAATDEAPALEAGRVDGIMIQDPFLTQIKSEYDFTSLGSPYSVLPYELPSGAFYSSTETIGKKPDDLRRWREAYAAATAYAIANPDLVREVIPEFTDVTPEAAAELPLPQFTTELNEDALGDVFAGMAQYGWINYQPSITQVYWDGE
ncbi:MAG TPA: ABC transporter substrate-binding protein [Ilumatobacter sp.]|nr:ABC transporter substrate-binding protein [Ilumatobacter sp.]